MSDLSQHNHNTWPRRNPVGVLYPSTNIEEMSMALGIKAYEAVLDVGGGANPLPEASAVVENNINSSHDRDGQAATVDRRSIAADIESLPFPDKSFDFVFCSHVLEHVRNPVQACNELMRVGKRGFIETPRKLAELVAGYPSHRWLIDVIDGVLTFERRWFVEHPLQNMGLAHILNYDSAREQALVNFRNLTCVQFTWDQQFDYKIIERDGWQELFDYDNPEHAGWSHFYFSLNLLANGTPMLHVKPHIDIALEKLPCEGVVYALEGVWKGIMGNGEEARQSFAKAKFLECNDESLIANIQLLEANSTETGKNFQLPFRRGPVRANRNEPSWNMS